jgi:8-oxo-dGTP diphosphatase
LTVKSKPDRDPRTHIVSIVYLVKVSEDAVPKAGDDAAAAEFYNLEDILELDKEKFAFDHYEILKELTEKKLNTI